MKKLLPLFFILCVAIQSQAQCDNSKRPIVFIHGFLASGDSYALQIQRFIREGYCADRLFVFDWNSVTRNGKKTDSLLNSFIDTIISHTGARQIDLAGHSAGGGLGRGYLIDSVHASKVAHYVHLGSNKWVKDFNWFMNNKCLNVYSKSDKIIGSGAGQIAGATNLDLENKDHYEVATSQETFEAIYTFLNEGAHPLKAKEKKVSPIQISGKAVYLGDNEPLRNSVVNVYQLHSKTGKRRTQKPNASFTVTANGHWGTFTATANKHYEMELVPDGENERTISFFFEPFTQSNSNIYLRGFPKGNMISMLLGSLPAKDSQSAIAIFSSNKAMIGGRDSVTINKIPVSSSLLTPASKTIISSFIFDDGDGISSGKALKQFNAAPFIGGVDISLPVNMKKVNIVYFNGRKLVLPKVSSKERILLAVFN
ncbi:MAG: alpha/beta fold hydrolase [Bacteroidota bacterium]|nr:alpha/beta fold hydrolase [Bacteroidota bacterium]